MSFTKGDRVRLSEAAFVWPSYWCGQRRQASWRGRLGTVTGVPRGIRGEKVREGLSDHCVAVRWDGRCERVNLSYLEKAE